MKKFSFENLEVWDLSRVLVVTIYKLSQEMPDNEKFGLTAQIKRAAVSVSNNIAEGVSRVSGKDQARFTEIAFGSLMEVLNLLILAQDLGLLPSEKVAETRTSIEKLANKLNSLRTYQLRSNK